MEGWWFAESSKLCQEEAWLQSKKTKNKNRQKPKENKEPGLSYPEGAQGKKEQMEKVRIPILKSLNSEINLGTPGEMQ